MKLTVVLNRSAGSLAGRSPGEAVAEVTAAFREAGHSVDCTIVPGAEVAGALERARDGAADVVVVGGGDGTIVSAARILADSGKALAVLPLGTMNLLARDLGIPFDIAEAARALAAGRIEAIDMGEVNGHPFLNNSAIGLYPRMVREREQERNRHGLGKWPAMLLAFGRIIAHLPRLTVAIDLGDGQGPQVMETPFLAVANNRYDQGFGPILRRTSLTRGTLAVYASRHRSRWRVLRLIATLFGGDWAGDPELQVTETTALTVRSRRPILRVANDGELLLLPTPLTYRIRPGALKVLRPLLDRHG
ncbi:MAG: hypothetical protein RLY86_98 [Pseudomonadota bacterium]|jgi:diacylglycerol kinase family enzyme